MRKRIDNLANGIFEYETPQIMLSENKLIFSLYSDEKKRGNFKITSLNGRIINGFLYSSSHRMTCLTSQFSGEEAIIYFEFNSIGLDEGNIYKGVISIVSNAGEYDLPFEVTVEKKYAKASFDKIIKNADDLAKLAFNSWDEAFKIFKSKDFRNALTEDENNSILKYDAFCNGNITMQDMEEFLIAFNVKKRIGFSLDNYHIMLKGFSVSKKEIIRVTKNCWGYINISIDIEGDFISIEKRYITSDDFMGSLCNIEYIINSDKLHNGNNYAKIVFTSPYECKTFDICVHKENREKNIRSEYLEFKQHIVELYNLYYDFRIRKKPLSIWAKDSISHLARISNIYPDNPWYCLMKAQFFIVSRQIQEAQWIIDKFQENKDEYINNVELWGYYLYICSLIEKENDYVKKIKNEIEELYKKNRASWILLWILLYIDEKYENSMNDKFHSIVQKLKEGCNSPVLFIEAGQILNEEPLLLSNLGDTQIKLLQFMYKQKFINKELAMQVMGLVSRRKYFDKTIYVIAQYCCEVYPSRENISIICSYLIRSDCRENKYKKWYTKGIEEDLRITRLYEYFIMSTDEKDYSPFPKIVYLYFRYNSNLDNKKKAFLYANLIKNKQNYPEIFKSYEKTIKQFMLDQLYKSVISDNMALVYNEFFFAQMINQDYALPLVNIMNSYKLKCDNSCITKVTVIYTKLNIRRVFSIIKGMAYLQIYSEEYLLAFSDSNDNTFISEIDYTLEKLINSDEYFKKCLRLIPSSSELIVNYLENEDKYYIPGQERVILLYNCLKSEEIKETYKKKLRRNIIEYYYQNDDQEYFEEHILKMSIEPLKNSEKKKLISILLRRGVYDKAYELIKQFGYEDIQVEDLLRMSNYIIETHNMEKNDLLVLLVHYIFEQGKYNEIILNYLANFYHGNIKSLIKLYKASESFKINTHDLKEIIIIQTLYTGSFLKDIDDIFSLYYKEGAKDSVKKAYLSYFSYGYFIKQQLISSCIFEYLEKEYFIGEDLNDVCKLTLLKYWSEKEKISNDQKAAVVNMLDEFSIRDMFFDFFHKFGQKLTLKYSFCNKMIIEYITAPSNKVEIHYLLDTDTYITEEMRNMFEGIFIKEITLFLGENFQYYITEESANNEQVVESGDIKKNDFFVDDKESRYDLINDMMLSFNIKDDETLIELMKQYEKQKYISERLFEIL